MQAQYEPKASYKQERLKKKKQQQNHKTTTAAAATISRCMAGEWKSLPSLRLARIGLIQYWQSTLPYRAKYIRVLSYIICSLGFFSLSFGFSISISFTCLNSWGKRPLVRILYIVFGKFTFGRFTFWLASQCCQRKCPATTTKWRHGNKDKDLRYAHIVYVWQIYLFFTLYLYLSRDFYRL